MSHNLTPEEMEQAKKLDVRFFASSEEQEREYLKEGMKRTETERYFYLMKLMKLQNSMKISSSKNKHGCIL